MASYKITEKLRLGPADGSTPGGISVTDGLGGVVTLNADSATTSYTLTLPPTTGNITEVMTENTGTGDTIWAPPPSPIFSMWTLEEKRAAGVNPIPAGPAVVNTWETRSLNTIRSSAGAGAEVTLSGNSIVLATGLYWIEVYTSSYNTLDVNMRLRDITAGVNVVNGTATTTNVLFGGAMSYDLAKAIYNVTVGPVSLDVQQRFENINSGNGYGVAASFGINEIYTVDNVQLVG